MPEQTNLLLYRAQILRMWAEAPAQHLPSWRFSLEDVRTGVRSGFADLDALIEHLMDLMEQPPGQLSDTHQISE
jgi:hypothetical protein